MSTTLRQTDILFNDATTLTSGNIPASNLGSGTANSTTYLRGDKTWQNISADVMGTIAAASAFSVGSITAAWNSTGTNVAVNGTISGSSLYVWNDRAPSQASTAESIYPSVFEQLYFAAAVDEATFPTKYKTSLTGTWKNIGGYCRGRGRTGTGFSSYVHFFYPSLWVRIS